ncbi:MAG: hypothetical protein HQ582_20295, partial [Planctomycetes bacterium]|nr:hypothetical protein [Planctomycetota bacterium]
MPAVGGPDGRVLGPAGSVPAEGPEGRFKKFCSCPADGDPPPGRVIPEPAPGRVTPPPPGRCDGSVPALGRDGVLGRVPALGRDGALGRVDGVLGLVGGRLTPVLGRDGVLGRGLALGREGALGREPVLGRDDGRLIEGLRDPPPIDRLPPPPIDRPPPPPPP